MYRAECETILNGISEAESVLQTLLDENLVSLAYGDEIRQALSKLSQAEDEANFIDNEDEPEEQVDAESLAYEVRRLEDSLDEIEGSCSDAQNRIENLKHELAEYL